MAQLPLLSQPATAFHVESGAADAVPASPMTAAPASTPTAAPRMASTRIFDR